MNSKEAKFSGYEQSNARYKSAAWTQKILTEHIEKEGMKMLMSLLAADERLIFSEMTQLEINSYPCNCEHGRYRLRLEKRNLMIRAATPAGAILKMLAALLDGAWYPLTPIIARVPDDRPTPEEKMMELQDRIQELEKTHEEDRVAIQHGQIVRHELEREIRELRARERQGEKGEHLN